MPGEAVRGWSDDDLIRIGRVGRPHGVHGAFYLDGAIDAAALVPGLTVTVGDHKFVVAGRAGTDAKPIVSLEGVNSRDQAAALRGAAVTAPRGALTVLGEGEWFASDLEGMVVVTDFEPDARRLGYVMRLLNLPSVDALEVACEGGGSLLVPMVRDAIMSIDPESRTVVVNERFLDLG